MTKMNEESYDLDFGTKDTLEVHWKKMTSNLGRIFLDEPITNPSKYRNVIDALESVSENDIIEFRLNTPGGNVYSALSLYNAILNCPAHTRAIVDGVVASAGTDIVMACDEVVVMKNTAMMCHAASYGTWGDMKSVRNHTEFLFDSMSRLTNEIYEGFLTQEEINNMIEHSLEYWMHDEEIIQRLKNRSEYLRNKDMEEEPPKPRTRKKKNA